MEHQSLIAVVPWTFIAQILNLLLQAYLFKRFLFKPVKEIINRRKQEVDGLYEQALEAKDAAEAQQRAYDGKLSAANEEAREILDNARNTARTRQEEILSRARQDAAAMKEKAQSDILLERKRAVNGMKDEMSRMALDIAEKVTEKEIRQEDHQRMIDRFIESLGDEQ